MESRKYNCLVIDDEPIARKVILQYIKQMPALHAASECIHALDAIDYLKTNKDIDIIFLDINMPNLSGLELIKIVKPHQPVILTTAYAEHAVESYELNVVDYLLKPFPFERFAKAVYKAVDILMNSHQNTGNTTTEPGPVIFIKSDGKNYPVPLDNILYCEAMKNYTMVILKDEQRMMPLITLTKFEKLLSEAGGDFIQVHRSFLASKKHITSIKPNVVTIGNYEIPIGIQYRENFFKAIGMKTD